ncbi:hypothetical protein [Saccharopolyspora cebuensis]|uniref:Uncharacterized protein n=1 Tax=Saccharopolyspora cebuensis TaxID=418759 RepID=A0ABV4CHU8_9PSEU
MFVIVVALLMVLIVGAVMFTDVVDGGGRTLKSAVAQLVIGLRPSGR